MTADANACPLLPTPAAFVHHLGPASPVRAELHRLHARHRHHPAVRQKREQWIDLLTAALGTRFTDDDDLFIAHTLLVATAKIVAHAIVGIDPASPAHSPRAIITGQLLTTAQIHGAVEPDCFDWISEVEGGTPFIRTLADHLGRFHWHEVDHDVLKLLYESTISPARRKQLGEYYTPDWLAHIIVDTTICDPLNQRVLDPSCGSGTFIFHAVRHHLAAATSQGLTNHDALTRLTRCVVGIDIHPVALTFARVTYLLAIGAPRLQAPDRPPLSIPIHHGDGIQSTPHTPHILDPFDILVGNPPWLSYRFMTTTMQREFHRLSKQRNLWSGGAAVATNQDLSALFILRTIERHLQRTHGRFAFVMPWSVLRSRQFAGFRAARYPLAHQPDLTLAFTTSWDLHAVKPAFFPVPCSVVHGRLAAEPHPLGADIEAWSGHLPDINIRWSAAHPHITRHIITPATTRPYAAASPYAARFSQGAILVPRVLFVVEPGEQPLAAHTDRRPIESRRNPHEKTPWKTLPALTGAIEPQFIRPMHMGETILPYRPLTPLCAVIPWHGHHLLDAEKMSAHPGLHEWWQRAESQWTAHRASDKLTLQQQLDYRQKLSQQFPLPEHRIVYTKSGMYLAAAIVHGDAIIDHSLYWGATRSLDEARYLEAILNSDALTRAVRPLQARGEHNPRHFDKYVWQLPIPVYSPSTPVHQRLVELAEQAEQLAAAVPAPGQRFETFRRKIREAIMATDVGRHIEREVQALMK